MSGSMIPRKLRWTKFHFTTKTGPNGHALWTSFLDLIALLPHKEVIEAIMVLGGEKFRQRLALVLRFLGAIQVLFPEWFSSETIAKRGSIESRKISTFPDKEGKVRVIAIGDY
jgi:hypothetical protein